MPEAAGAEKHEVLYSPEERLPFQLRISPESKKTGMVEKHKGEEKIIVVSAGTGTGA
jgi:hypothetical protein